MEHTIDEFMNNLLARGYDYDRNPEVEPIVRFAIMVANGVPPLAEAAEGTPPLQDAGRHIEHDVTHGWPLDGGTTLRQAEYEAIWRRLKELPRAHRCVCGNITAYGNGAGPKHADGVTGVFCSADCRDRHHQRLAG
jgi:hypothetical protein